jgi:hypothetical protein
MNSLQVRRAGTAAAKTDGTNEHYRGAAQRGQINRRDAVEKRLRNAFDYQ